MDLKAQFMIKNNPYLARYLHENSYLYKLLNRNPSSIFEIEKKMKEKYKLTASDKVENISKKIELVQNLMDLLN